MWGDGIDMMASSDITISGAFVRTSDDCIAIYGSRWGYRGDSRNVLIQDSVFWADKAHAMFMAISGDYQGDGDMIENITFRNIDVLESDGQGSKFQGAMEISCGDKNIVKNVLYEDIRVEHIYKTATLICIGFRVWRDGALGKSIENVTFRNIVYDGPCGSVIQGHSPHRRVKVVRFENVKIRGKTVRKPADGKIAIGPHVTGVVFRDQPEKR
jgi:polygalacturonase